MKHIGIIGSGIVAKTLAGGFLSKGYSVKVGSGTPEKLESWKSELGKDLFIGTFAEAAAFGETLVLAVKGTAAKSVLASIPDEFLEGKVVIDTCNPIADQPPVDGVLRFFTGPNSSLLEELQAAAPKVRFVKAFSCIGAPHMVNPNFDGVRPTLFGCGDDTDAKVEVERIVTQFGFDWADMGGAVSARAIEPLCILWCIPGLTKGSWNHAFKLLEK